VRCPTISALISLEILLALTVLSRVEFEKLWMTVDFVDVMIIDRDTTAFFLAVFPSLRWWIVLVAAATALAVAIAGGSTPIASGRAPASSRSPLPLWR
jgi:hypothetical protein